MVDVYKENLIQRQKEAIAEQFAELLFRFWQDKQDNSLNSSDKAVAVGPGLLRNFPEKPKATT